MRTVYGPIDSWRFGRSLGIDPLGRRAKVCPFSCIYCQYGPTVQPTLQRQAFVSAEQLQSDLEELGPIDCDQVTFAGLGEPTLARNLAELVYVVRTSVDRPVAILTGSALMPRSDVRRDLLHFDHVVVKLDAPNEGLFRQINRPGPAYPYSWAALVDGIRIFRQAFTGHISLQMMFVQVNAGLAPQMVELANALEPDQVHLDTPLQPAFGGPVSPTQMDRIEHAFAALPAHVTIRSIFHAGQARITPRAL